MDTLVEFILSDMYQGRTGLQGEMNPRTAPVFRTLGFTYAKH
jgi:hypothetical protein